MRLLVCLLLFSFAQFLSAQENVLAKQYYNNGAFDKAVVFYEKLVQQNPRRTDYLIDLIGCYQQLERYSEAEALIKKQLSQKNVHPVYYIELGHNFALQDFEENANVNYNLALSKIDENPNLGYGVGYRFQGYSLLDYATKAYNKAMMLNPALDYNYQLARIYGEQGDVEKMFSSYLSLIYNGKNPKSNILRNISDFINEDPDNENNVTLRRLLLKNAQKNPDVVWNEILSWLFMQQKQYNSAFNQEKAIYKRSDTGSLRRLEMLGNIVLEDEQFKVAESIFEYVIANSNDKEVTLNSELQRIKIRQLLTKDNKLNDIQKQYENLLEVYGYHPNTVQLQVSYAKFLTFDSNTPLPAIALLKKTLALPLTKFGKSYVKMALGDILVYDKKFNQALIYFSQIQKDLKNDIQGQNARYKVAQTSFYKGDFDWALTQLKVLRSSTSQLIANDAMQLSLLISDNSLEDSTKVALKKYASADFLAFQNKTKDAITLLDDILQNHKGEKIEDEALLKQGKLRESLKEYEAAEFNYIKIVEFYGKGILADDAHFALGELYRTKLQLPEKAKHHYEKIIYDYQDSYYFPMARKEFRKLRGDAIN